MARTFSRPGSCLGHERQRQALSPNGFFETIKSMLEKHAVNPRLLKLELTESMLLEQADETIPTMTVLKSIGVQFALDDFGMGYSSSERPRSSWWRTGTTRSAVSWRSAGRRNRRPSRQWTWTASSIVASCGPRGRIDDGWMTEPKVWAMIERIRRF